jgi:hypothetical protein
MPMKKKLLFFLLFTSLNTAATTHLAILGGGGEPQGNNTVFDADLSTLGAFASSNPQYRTRVAFNGGHSATEAIAQQHFPSFNSSNHFTRATFEETIRAYEAKLQSGEIGPGDQLLLHINSHGGVRENATHNIATSEGSISNYDTLGSPTVSMDRLSNLAALARRKGVRLAIVDLSCHSGASLALANSNTCVITSTGPNHYAYIGSRATFGSSFNRNLASGRNLEEVFLQTRANYRDNSFPMISSPQGLDVQSRLYTSITPYLYTRGTDRNDKLTRFMEADASRGERCELTSGHNALISEVEEILRTVNDEEVRTVFTEFRRSVDAYYAYLDSLRNRMLEVGFGEMKRRHTFCSTSREQRSRREHRNRHDNRRCIDYSVENLMTLNFDQIYSNFERAANDSRERRYRLENLATMDNIRQARLMRDELIRTHPEYARAQSFWSDLPRLHHETLVMAHQVSTSQQLAYDRLYRRSTATGPNPCRDFVL